MSAAAKTYLEGFFRVSGMEGQWAAAAGSVLQ